MKVLASINVPGRPDKHIDLCHGDLTAIPNTESFDVLVVSAFPNNYIPTPGSLIGALFRKGVSVSELALTKEADLRDAFSCWLSRELRPADAGLRFTRLLCFEPQARGRPPEVVGDIFRALTPIVAEHPEIKSLAMPIVAAGDQRYSVQEMLRPILEASLHWLAAGLPLDRIAIVVRDDSLLSEALRVFSEEELKLLPAVRVGPADHSEFDVFISYSRANTREMRMLQQALRNADPAISIFIDQNDIDIGEAWQPKVFESLDNCRKVVAMLSPDYLASKVCKEEFNIAWIRARESNENVLFPIYLYSAALPTYMRYKNFLDCREGDISRLSAASAELTKRLST